MKKILVVFGTRPGAIKMCPVVNELKKSTQLKTIVCVTGQHRELLDQVLKVFNVVPDYNLHIMKEGQDLFDITNNVLTGMKKVLKEEKPDVVLVHGDTTTAQATALSAFYLQIPVGHVEAGLRTYNIYSPYPEEYNRQMIGLVSRYHFAPTETARMNLLKEGKLDKEIFVTGNTGIDALKTTVNDTHENSILEWAKGSRLIVITAHRRENIGSHMHHMFRAIRRIVEENKDIKAVYPVHLNPLVQKEAKEELGDCDRVRLIKPLDVIDFHNLLARSFLVLTDSGGIQEEAPALGKPVLVMRDTTERPEGVMAGTLRLVGTSEEGIYNAAKELLTDENLYKKMATAKNPYGDGKASQRIRDILENA